MAACRVVRTGASVGTIAALAAFQLRKYREGVLAETARARKEKSSSEGGTCIVVGAGIVGLTTAYYLCRTGKYANIHVIDQHEDCSQGASFQNGGVINVEAIAPVNSYMNMFATIKSSLLYQLTGADANTLVTWRAVIEPPGLMLRWVWYFFKNNDEDSIQRNAAKMLKLGDATGNLFEEAMQHLGLDAQGHNFCRTPGLVLFHAADPEATVTAKHARFGAVKKKMYVTGQELEKIKKESALLGLEGHDYNIGCLEPDNLTINTMTFCQSLRRYLESKDVRFHFCSEVRDCVKDGSAIKALILDDGASIEAKHVVLCAGYETCYLLRSLGIGVPLAPVKAYSLHIRNAAVASRLKYATHLEAGIDGLVTPYRDTQPASVRVTGIRDLDGFNTLMREDRLFALMRVARSFVGTDFDAQTDTTAWAGVMSMSPDDFPMVGPLAKYDNLFINVGHGFRGTNWSMTTAKLLSEVMTGDSETVIDPQMTSPSRFGI